MVKKNKITILGTGAFGTAVADELANIDINEVILYGVDQKEIKDINVNHRNSKYFHHVKLNAKLNATDNLKDAILGSDMIIIGLPSHVIRDVLKEVVSHMKKPAYFINLSKGIDYTTIKLISDLIKEVVPTKLNKGIFKLSGGSYASELMKKEPTLFTLGCEDIKVCNSIIPLLQTNCSKVECLKNLRGVEAVSVIKNPLAIMLGIIEGLGYKMNARAFLFKKALEEMKLMLALFDVTGNIDELILSASGIGDLILTGTSDSSRNFSTGLKIGQVDKVNKKILSTFVTVEGIRSIELILVKAKSKDVKLPIIEMLYNISYKRIIPSKVVKDFFIKYRS